MSPLAYLAIIIAVMIIGLLIVAQFSTDAPDDAAEDPIRFDNQVHNGFNTRPAE
jgi:hypothetical protein